MECNIWNEKVRVKLYTGAEVNVMPDRVYQQLVTKYKEIPESVKLKTTPTKLQG